jgi:hypothetical protein
MIRISALGVLGALRNPESVPPIAAMLKREDDGLVRCAAARAYIVIDSQLGRRRNVNVTVALARFIAECDADAAASATALSNFYQEPQRLPEEVSAAVEEALERMSAGGGSEHNAELCLRMIRDGERLSLATRWRALLSLQRVTPPHHRARARDAAVEMLLQADDGRTRRLGLRTLALVAEVGDARARDAYARTLCEGHSTTLRMEASSQLARITPTTRPKFAAVALHQALLASSRDDGELCRRAIGAALRRVSAKCCPAEGAVAVAEQIGAAATREGLERAVKILIGGCSHGESGEGVQDGDEQDDDDDEDDEEEEEDKGHENEVLAFIDRRSPLLRAKQRRPGVADSPDASIPMMSHKGVVGMMEHLKSRHCIAALRALPQQQLLTAFRRFREVKACDLENEGQARTRGALLVRGALGREEISQAYAHWSKYLRGNQSGNAQPGNHVGRTIWRSGGAPLPEALTRRLDGLLDGLASRGVLPTAWPRAMTAPGDAALGSEGSSPQVQDSAEYIELDVLQQKQSCPQREWQMCGTDWHVDGGLRGFKLWVLLRKDAVLRPGFDWRAVGVDPASPAREHANLVIAPSSNLRGLCDLALELNRTGSWAEEEGSDRRGKSGRPKGGGGADDCTGVEGVTDAKQVVISASDQVGQCIYERAGELQQSLKQNSEIFSRERDKLALEAASCPVHADEGDMLLTFPDVFHRTQDIAASRLALLAEAM